jgi:superfamily II DNA or RNA helicase
MNNIKRYSSKQESLHKQFFKDNLMNASNYYRIAGYFSTAILGLAEEEFLNIDGCIKIICNSDVTKKDIEFAKKLKSGSSESLKTNEVLRLQIKDEWDKNKNQLRDKINKYTNTENNHFFELYQNLTSQENNEPKIQIKIIPKDFKFLHGKAGLIEYKNGESLTFAGSMNETPSGWEHNYEILWSDNSNESKEWFIEEFNYLWNSEHAIELSDYVIEDIKKMYEEEVIPIKDVEDLQKLVLKEPAVILKASPIYKNGAGRGLWEHQEAFVELVLKEHFNNSYGARFVLSDMVGLGKTIEMGAFAKLLATTKCKPILFIVPKTITKQWQDELMNHFKLPSAIWEFQSGKYGWSCEDSYFQVTSFKDCPRKIGIVSQGLITSNSNQVQDILNINYECVFIDEAHRARRNQQSEKTLYKNRTPEKNANNLYKFIYAISSKTKSLILATATPIQLYPTDLWDLLHLLAVGNNQVLGDDKSLWNTNVRKSIGVITGKNGLYASDLTPGPKFKILTNPLIEPNISKSPEMKSFFHRLNSLSEDKEVDQELFGILIASDFFIKEINENYFKNNNPFTFRVIRRTRSQLEKKGLIKKIKISPREISINSNHNLKEIFELCSDYSKTLETNSGFFKHILLRRVSSSIYAGECTINRLLDKNASNLKVIYDEDNDDIDFEVDGTEEVLSEYQKKILYSLRSKLEIEKRVDNKLKRLQEIIKTYELYQSGVIIFSQFYDTAYYIFNSLVEKHPKNYIGLYAGGNKSLLYDGEDIKYTDKNTLKKLVSENKIKILVGTDAASEGLNLQTMNSIINIDLPYNPIRLEQRKGRIHRIGQMSDTIYIFNLLYTDSVDNRVIELLKTRFKTIFDIFSEVPDTIKVLWDDIVENKDPSKTLDKINKELDEKRRFEIKETPFDEKLLHWEKEVRELKMSDLLKLYRSKWEI